MRTLSVFLFVSLLAAIARAQSAHWEPSGGTFAVDRDNDLKLIFENCTPTNSSVKLPPVPDLLLRPVGTYVSSGSGLSITINGSHVATNSSSSGFAILYQAHPAKLGPLQIPAFTVATDKGDVRVPALSVNVENSPAAAPNNGGNQNGSSLGNIARSTLSPSHGEFWAGEVFTVSYALDVTERYQFQPAPSFQWSPDPLIVEDWSRPEPFETTLDDGPHFDAIWKTRGYVKNAGDVTLSPARHTVRFLVSNAFSIFAQPTDIVVTSNTPSFTIKPLPAAPPNFTGAVGQFDFKSTVSPRKVAVGEPITWSLALSGTGNWPEISALPAREVSQDFQVVSAKPKRDRKNGALFDATLSEDAVLIPSKPGTYTLPPVQFVYFEPKSGSYKTLTADSFEVTVTPAANPPPTVATGGAVPNLKMPGQPAPPTALPREPLNGTANAPVPWSRRILIAAVASPFALLLVLWLGLALRRARATDPRRAQREAYARLAETLAEFRRAADAPTRTRLLLDWQRDAAILARLQHAAPSANALHDQAWERLWREADHAIYAADQKLPDDWVERATTALVERRAPRFSLLSTLLPRNLLPFAASIALVLSLRAATAPADDPAAAYRAGDFAAAAAGWQNLVANSPTNWIARHNLGLALAQQDRWPEAAAQWTAAFVQHPKDQTLRWNLSLGFEHAGYAVSDITAFVPPGPVQTVAQFASPAEWQRILVAASALAAAALALLLLRGYGLVRGWANPVGLIILVLALLVAAGSAVGLRAFGPAAEARAAVVWRNSTLRSIPTEAETTQKTSPLAAGNLAVVDKTFLDWSRLVFENGEIGWVRTDDLVNLWK